MGSTGIAAQYFNHVSFDEHLAQLAAQAQIPNDPLTRLAAQAQTQPVVDLDPSEWTEVARS
jgi:hypothetical protein